MPQSTTPPKPTTPPTSATPPKLSTPTNVSMTVSADKTKITVSWQDSDPPANIANFTVSLVPKDGSTPPQGLTKTTTDGKTTSMDFPVTAGSTPTADELNSNYVATIVANPTDSKTFSASDPGSQYYWDINVSLYIKVGSQPITLTKPSGSNGTGGVYSLPASKAKPITISAGDINSLVGQTVVPATFLDKPLPTLSISDLAIDTNNQLFKMGVSVNFSDLSLFSIAIESLTFEVERKDGVHHTLDNTASSS